MTEAQQAAKEELEQLGRFAEPAVLGAIALQFKAELDRLRTFVGAFAEPEVPAAVTAATTELAEAMGDVAGANQLVRESLTATIELLREVTAKLEALPETIDRVVSDAVARELQSLLGARH